MLHTLSSRNQKQAGFTLVELAIVLVIIGLIVGGVLVGQDLIKSAEIRATISQLEKYNAGSTTFRDKFGGMPGDLVQARAVQFNLLPTTRAGTNGASDGDGAIENGNGTTQTTQGLGFETRAYWSDLSQADLIQEGMAGVALAVTARANANALLAANEIPTSKIADTTFVHVYSINGRNFFYLGGITAIVATTGVVTQANGVTPQQAFSIDEKLDDGVGNSGSIVFTDNITTNATPTGAGIDDGAAGACLNGTVYNTDEPDAQTVACQLSIRTSF